MEFLLGVALTVVAYAVMPPKWSAAASWFVRDRLVVLRAWWNRQKRRGGE